MRCVLARYFLCTFLQIIFCSNLVFSDSEVTSQSDLKKRADHFFTSENYESALPDYSRLLSLYPHETIYNYRFGVCLLLAGKEKSNASTYLEIAVKDPAVPEEAWYYLGRSYMVNNDFSRAKDAFEKFKSIANVTKQKKFDVDASIQNCNSGSQLVQSRKNIVIANSTEVAINSFYNNYDFSVASGKIVNASQEFLTPLDREKQKDPVMFISNNKQKILLASYGKKGENGKDIYIIRKTPTNQWSLPENLGSVVNSPEDEDFPFLDRDGRTLYFSSRGHNSVGGYDIFKTVFDLNTGQWSEPENLGIPINTVGDDFLFVPNEKGPMATYATTTDAGKNSIVIRKIKLPVGRDEMLTISGTYIPVDQKVRRDARISILTSDGDGVITTVHTDPLSGKYELVLQPGQSYMIVVEGGGYLPHAEIFDLPAGMTNPDLKQVVKMNRQNQKEELTLQNYFASGAIASEPSNSFTKTFSTDADTSAMIGVKINDQIVYVTPPSSGTKNTSNEKDGIDRDQTAISGKTEIENNGKAIDDTNALPSIKVKRRDKYDPTLENGLSSGEVHQMEEEAGRTKEIEEDESKPSSAYDSNVSNDDLARIAYSDAQVIQDEADSLKNEAAKLRKSAVDKQNLSVVFKNQSETPGLDPDSSASLMAKSETNHFEAEQLNKQADDLKATADLKNSEAETAVAEANELFNTTGASGKIASESKKTKGSTQANDRVKKNSKKPVNGTVASEKTAENISNDAVVNENKTKNLNSSDNQPVSVAGNENSISGNEKNTIPDTEKQDEKNINEKLPPVISDEAVSTKETDNCCEDANPPKPLPLESLAQDENKSASKIKTDEQSVSEVKKTMPSNNKTVNEASFTGNKADGTEPGGNNSSIAVNNSVKGNENAVNPGEQKNTGVSPGKKHFKIDDYNSNTIKPTAENNDNSVTQNKDANTAADSIDISGSETDKNKNDGSKINQEQVMKSSTSKGGIENSRGNEKQVENSDVVSEKKLSVSAAGTEPDVNSANKTNPVLVAGDAPHAYNASDSIITDASEFSLQPVNEKAKALYREFQKRMAHSKELNLQAVNLQSEITQLHSTPKRDSLIRETNDLALESNHQYQEGLSLIEQARKIEPAIEYKMSVNDYITNNRKGTSQFTDVKIARPEKQEINNSPETSIDIHASKDNTENLSVNAAAKKQDEENISQNTPDTKNVLPASKDNTENLSVNAAAKKPGEDNSPQQTPDVKNVIPATKDNTKNQSVNAVVKKPVEMNNSHNSSDATGENDIDTLHPDYPKYVEIKKQITNKQVETIDVFADAINLNKKALEEKDLEMTLMDKAQVEPNEEKKSELIKESFRQKALSDKHSDESQEKLKAAQLHTNEVKGMKKDLAVVKENIIRKPVQDAGTTNIESVSPEKNSVDVPAQKPAVETTAVNGNEKEPVKKSKPVPVQKPAVETTAVNGNEKELIKKSKPVPAQPFAMADKENADLNVSEEEVTSVSVSKEESADFIANRFNNSNKSIYSENNPIPMNPVLPDGLVFKVQVGAFHKPLPSDIFKGLQPISGETTRPGWVRYCAGLFKTFEPANIVKKDIQKLGYRDAFVVAYYNGKRIELNAAYAMVKEKGSLTAYKSESAKEIAMLRSINIHAETASNVSGDKDERSFYGKTPVADNNVSTSAVEYAVQVGVYRTPVAPSVLASLQPLRSEEIRANLYRFFSGRYPNRSSAEIAKQNAVNAGVSDAFIVVYKNGNAADVAEKPPAVRSSEKISGEKTPVKSETVIPENTPTGIIFKIQIGAYKNDVPYNMVESYLAISDKSITRETDDRNLHIFYAGNCKSFSEAVGLRDEIISKGVSDAFIVAIRNGKRIPISEEMKK